MARPTKAQRRMLRNAEHTARTYSSDAWLKAADGIEVRTALALVRKGWAQIAIQPTEAGRKALEQNE